MKTQKHGKRIDGGLEGLKKAWEEEETRRKPRKGNKKVVEGKVPGADAVKIPGKTLVATTTNGGTETKVPSTTSKDPVVASLNPAPTTLAPTDLPDLNAIDVKPMTQEARAAADAEYKRRKDFAEGAGTKLAAINREITEIEADPERLALDLMGQERLTALKAARQRLTVPDEGVRKHIEFSELVAGVKSASQSEAGKWIAEATTKGRIRTTAATTGSNLIFWAGRVYEPVPDGTGKITSATLGLVAELRRLTDAAKVAQREERNAAIAALKSEATAGMTLTAITLSTTLHAGKIYVFLPPKEEEIRGEKRWIGASHILVECDGIILRPIRAVGRLENFFAELTARKRFVAVADLKTGRYSGPRVADDIFRDIVGLLNILRAAMYAEVPAAKTPTTPPAGK